MRSTCPTGRKIACSRCCGQVVRDAREVVVDGRVLCKPCTETSYFSLAREVTWPDMNWTPETRNDGAGSTAERAQEQKCPHPL